MFRFLIVTWLRLNLVCYYKSSNLLERPDFCTSQVIELEEHLYNVFSGLFTTTLLRPSLNVWHQRSAPSPFISHITPALSSSVSLGSLIYPHPFELHIQRPPSGRSSTVSHVIFDSQWIHSASCIAIWTLTSVTLSHSDCVKCRAALSTASLQSVHFVPRPPKTFDTGVILFSGIGIREWVCTSQKPCEHHMSKTIEGNFTQFWLQMYLGSQMCRLDSGVRGQGHSRQRHSLQWQPVEFHLVNTSNYRQEERTLAVAYSCTANLCLRWWFQN